MRTTSMRKYELVTNWGLPHNSIFANRDEQNRFTRILTKCKIENPKATIAVEIIMEDLAYLHILSQRLRDKRYFFDGDESDWQKVDRYKLNVSSEHLRDKQAEFKKWFSEIQKAKMELLKLAMASNVQLHVHGDAGSVSDLFASIDEKGITLDNIRQGQPNNNGRHRS